MAVDSNEINQMLGLPPVEFKQDSSEQSNLLSANEKSQFLTPKPVWYSRTSTHILLAFLGMGVFIFVVSLFLGVGTPQPKQVVAATSKEKIDQQLKNDLDNETKRRQKAEEEAWKANQPQSTTIKDVTPEKKNSSSVRSTPNPPATRPASVPPRAYVSAPPTRMPASRVPSTDTLPRQRASKPQSAFVRPTSVSVVTPKQYIKPESSAETLARLNKVGVILDGGDRGGSRSISSSSYSASSDSSYISSIPQISGSGPSTPSPNADLLAATPASMPSFSSGGFKVPQREEAKAKMIDPIVWSKNSPIDGQTFQAQLSEKFGSIPKGSVITLQPNPASKSASVSPILKLIAMTININGTDYPAPQGLLVKSSGGSGAIQAKTVRPGSGFGLGDILRTAASIGVSGLAQSASRDGSFLENAGIQAGSQLVQGAVYSGSAPQQGEQYYKFDGSIKLVATQDLSI